MTNTEAQAIRHNADSLPLYLEAGDGDDPVYVAYSRIIDGGAVALDHDASLAVMRMITAFVHEGSAAVLSDTAAQTARIFMDCGESLGRLTPVANAAFDEHAANWSREAA